MQWKNSAILGKVYIRRYSVLLVTYMLTSESYLSVELLMYVLQHSCCVLRIPLPGKS